MKKQTFDDKTTSAPSTNSTITMRAIVQHAYGSAEVLHMEEIGQPTIDDGEVLIRVHAAGLDRGIWHFMTGLAYPIRLMSGLRTPTNPVLGLDVSGTIVAIGKAVTRFAVGDQVFGIAKGSFAEYASAREDRLAHKPANLTFDQAAAVAVSGLTALQALRDVGRIEAGQHILIIGASGGVGTFAVQIAKSLGAEVTGVCSAAKIDLVRALGADHTIDYTTDDFADSSIRYDLILDIGGNASVSRLRRALSTCGTLVIVGGENGGRLTGGMGRQLRAIALSPFLHQRLTMKTPKENFADLERLAQLIEAGQLTPSIERTFSLPEVPEAMRHLVAGNARGKLVISVTDAA